MLARIVARIPRILAHVWRRLGYREISTRLVVKVAMKWTTQRAVTVMAVLYEGSAEGFFGGVNGVARGKKMRKRNSLSQTATSA